MKKLIASLFALIPAIAFAQIIGFSGAPVVSSNQFLVQLYGTPGVLLSTTKENSSFAGNCMTVRRASDSTTSALGWAANGKDCATTVFDSGQFCSGTTCFLNTWNDQSGNGLDCVQSTTARQPQVIKDTDNKVSIKTTSTSQGCEIADNAAIRFTTPEVYWISRNTTTGCQSPGDEMVQLTYGPTGDGENARWSFKGSYPQQRTLLARNGSVPNDTFYGQALWCGDIASYYIMNFRPATQDLRAAAGYQVIPATSSTSITYTGTIKLVVGNTLSYNIGSANQSWRTVVVYDTGVSNANRNAINNFLSSSASQNLTAIPWTFTSSDGYAFQTFSQIGCCVGIDDGPDAFGNTWNYEDGGYLWSVYKATNLTSPSTTTLTRHEARPGDFDTVTNGEERAERILLNNTNPTWQRGGFMSNAFLLYFEPGTCLSVAPGWDYNSQMHTGAGAEPSNISWTFAISGLGGSCDQFRMVTQNGSDTVVRGSAFNITRGVWYQVVIHAFWSSNGIGDVLKAYIGPRGSPPLTQIANVTADHMFWEAPATDANLKQGTYNNNLNAPISYRLGNWQWSQTQDAYTAKISSPDAIPAHNFLLKRDLEPAAAAANDNTPMWLDQAA